MVGSSSREGEVVHHHPPKLDPESITVIRPSAVVRVSISEVRHRDATLSFLKSLCSSSSRNRILFSAKGNSLSNYRLCLRDREIIHKAYEGSASSPTQV